MSTTESCLEKCAMILMADGTEKQVHLIADKDRVFSSDGECSVSVRSIILCTENHLLPTKGGFVKYRDIVEKVVDCKETI